MNTSSMLDRNTDDAGWADNHGYFFCIAEN